jgi:predicted lipid-binding transport protein (Tim44 family)
MKKFWTICGVFLVSLTLALTAADANAAKFGGKRSFGKSYRTAPAQQAQPVNSAKPGVNQPATGAAKKGMFGGLMGGLLAGGLLAWMFGSGAFQGLQLMDMLIMAGVAFLAFKLFRSMSQAKNGSMSRQPAAAYSPAAPAPSSQPSPFAAYTSNQEVQTGHSGFNDVPFNLPPSFDLQQFLNGARDHYRTLQEAWNRNDFSKIQEYVTPELYNGLVEERKNHPGEQQTEVMFVDAELVRADYDANQAQISVKFKGRYRDTVEGIEEPIDEIWHLERDLSQTNAPWLIVGIEQ